MDENVVTADRASDAAETAAGLPAPRSAIDAEEIYARIPHDGAMRLLDHVLSWDARSILCCTTSYGDRANPLGDRGVLHNVFALEYAAQAIAVHGSLLRAGDPSGAGAALKAVYVSTFRDVHMKSATLETQHGGPLHVRAELYAAVGGAWSYGFTVTLGDRTIIRGQATLVVPGEDA